MKYAGKITLFTAITLIAITSCLYLAQGPIEGARAASEDNARFGFVVPVEWGVADIDNVYCVFIEEGTQYLAHKTTGTPAVNTSWTNAAVVGAKQSTTDSGGTNPFSWVCDPLLHRSIQYGAETALSQIHIWPLRLASDQCRPAREL